MRNSLYEHPGWLIGLRQDVPWCFLRGEVQEGYHNDIPIGDDCEVCRGLGCLLAPLWLLELAEPVVVVVMMAGGAARGGPAGEASAMLGRELEATHVDEWGGKEREKEA